jgi:hypothetical protein
MACRESDDELIAFFLMDAEERIVRALIFTELAKEMVSTRWKTVAPKRGYTIEALLERAIRAGMRDVEPWRIKTFGLHSEAA